MSFDNNNNGCVERSSKAAQMILMTLRAKKCSTLLHGCRYSLTSSESSLQTVCIISKQKKQKNNHHLMLVSEVKGLSGNWKGNMKRLFWRMGQRGSFLRVLISVACWVENVGELATNCGCDFKTCWNILWFSTLLFHPVSVHRIYHWDIIWWPFPWSCYIHQTKQTGRPAEHPLKLKG